jgi:hypothetical protein
MVTNGVGVGVGVGIDSEAVGCSGEVGWPGETGAVEPAVGGSVGTGEEHAVQTASTTKDQARKRWVTAPYPMLAS